MRDPDIMASFPVPNNEPQLPAKVFQAAATCEFATITGIRVCVCSYTHADHVDKSLLHAWLAQVVSTTGAGCHDHFSWMVMSMLLFAAFS